jgi:hypothetical protein
LHIEGLIEVRKGGLYENSPGLEITPAAVTKRDRFVPEPGGVVTVMVVVSTQVIFPHIAPPIVTLLYIDGVGPSGSKLCPMMVSRVLPLVVPFLGKKSSK